MEVIVTGRITTYPGRSQYQIIIETMAPAGVGALLAQLERLKAKLAAEGLFETARKRPLPVDAGGDRRDHQPDRRGDPRHPAPHPRALAVPGDRLAHRWCRARSPPRRWPPPSPASTPCAARRADPAPGRADRGARRRLGGGPLAVQRRGPGPRGGGQRHPADLGGRARDRHHPDRLRLRPPRADAHRRGRDGDAGAGRARRGARRLRAAADHLRRARRSSSAAPGWRPRRAACHGRRTCWRSPRSGSTSPPGG